MTASDVIAGTCPWSVEAGDCIDWLKALPTNCCSLSLTSPPYEDARTYGIDYKLKRQAWVDWMVPRVIEACRVVDGLVCVNMAGKVEDRQYNPIVEWLVADLTRQHGIVCGPAPYVYFRFGIPGSGGNDYHRRDWEPIYCFAKPESLPVKWSDNTAMGHPPKLAPGGEMSHRLSNGSRVNDPSKKNFRHAADGTVKGGHARDIVGKGRKVITKHREGMHNQDQDYQEPKLANPGNVVKELYDAEEVRQLLMGGELGGPVKELSPNGDVIRCLVGGGVMGSKLAHEGEAPYSERLCEYFIRSYAPPDSIVLDFFCGTSTTGAAARSLGRRYIGCDLRQSQVDLSHRRLGGVVPCLEGFA